MDSHLVVTNKSKKVIETENPNGYDPLFNWTIIHSNEFLQSYNVTYLGSVTKNNTRRIPIADELLTVASFFVF